MNSTIGFSPAKAAPTPTPAKPYSVIGRVDHAHRPELVEQALGHFIGALILADLLAHHEHRRVGPHLLGHGVAQRLAHGELDHLRAGRDFGFAPRLLGRVLRAGRRLLDIGQALAELARGSTLRDSSPLGRGSACCGAARSP